MINIYYTYIEEDIHENLLAVFLPKQSIAFQDKIKKYRRWQDAQLSLSGHVMLFKAIKEKYNLNYSPNDILYTKYKKPYFEDNSIKFNISHSEKIVICALSDELDIGIDIEFKSNIKISDFKTQMTEKEWNKITISNDKTEAFFDYWTQKESVIKAHGNGLTIPLKSFEILDISTEINGEIFFLKEIDIDANYKCHISSTKEIDTKILKINHIKSIL